MKTFSKVPNPGEKTRIIICPLCGNKIYSNHWKINDSSFVKCSKCSLIYQNPQPIAEDVALRYDNSYFNYEITNENIFLNLILLGLKDVGFIPANIQTGTRKILDIGCATGLFLEFMKKNGWDAYGVEICESAADYGIINRNLNIYKGFLENLSVPHNSFDIIHFSHVIEHINDPLLFLENVYNLLKPGGVVYCVTPNISGFQARLFKQKWRSAIPDHLVLYSVKTLKMLFKNSNFKVIKYKTWGGLCANSGYPVFLKKILDKLAKPLGFGDVVIIKAVKPH